MTTPPSRPFPAITPSQRIVEAVSAALQRLRADLSVLLQKTAAAAAAWFIAKHVIQHHEPFFAPIAAVVALNTSLGERGSNTMRLLVGVLVGIVAGEITIRSLGSGYGTLALATFAAMAVASLLGGSRIVVAQAAASAILTMATATEDAGRNRLVDAFIGAGVALSFSQLFFSPEPVALLRSAETAALDEMAVSLGLTASALESDDRELVVRATDRLRHLRDRLSELAEMRSSSASTARYSLVWRARLKMLVGESESAAQLDLLGGSCLTLARIAMATRAAGRPVLAPRVRELEGAIADLAHDPADRTCRQRAADRMREIATAPIDEAPPADSAMAAAAVAVRMVAVDVMLFVGVQAPGRGPGEPSPA